jgi:hypothetical protein
VERWGGVKFKRRNVGALTDLVCGNLGSDSPGPGEEAPCFVYRSNKYLTEFFAELDTDYVHNGSTRKHWVADRIDEILVEPHDGPTHPWLVARH